MRDRKLLGILKKDRTWLKYELQHDINHLHFLFWIFDGGWLVIGYLIPQHNGGSNVFTEG